MTSEVADPADGVAISPAADPGFLQRYGGTIEYLLIPLVFGLGAPLSSLWLAKNGCADSIAGDNTGVCYLGMALAAAAVPWLMRRWGKGCTAAGCLAPTWPTLTSAT